MKTRPTLKVSAQRKLGLTRSDRDESKPRPLGISIKTDLPEQREPSKIHDFHILPFGNLLDKCANSLEPSFVELSAVDCRATDNDVE